MSSSSLSPAQKLDLSDPDRFELASAVVKNSRSGITSHKRFLVIKKGYLYYYSNVPKNFKGDPSIVQTIHELPKCSIEIVNIKQIKGYESNSSYFSIEFQSRHMLQRQDIRKTMTLQEYNFSPKNTSQTIVWQFTCDNQFIKQRWVAALQGLHQHYTKQKKDIEKFFNQNSNISEMKSSSSGGRDSRVPWRQSQTHSGNNNRGSYKRYGEVSFLQLVGTKSNDQKERSTEKQGAKIKTQINTGGKSTIVATFQNQAVIQEKIRKAQTKQSLQPLKKKQNSASNQIIEKVQSPFVGIESRQQSRREQNIPDYVRYNSNNKNNSHSGNSPIKGLQLSEIKINLQKQEDEWDKNQQSKGILFSQTRKIHINQDQQQLSESSSSSRQQTLNRRDNFTQGEQLQPGEQDTLRVTGEEQYNEQGSYQSVKPITNVELKTQQDGVNKQTNSDNQKLSAQIRSQLQMAASRPNLSSKQSVHTINSITGYKLSKNNQRELLNNKQPTIMNNPQNNLNHFIQPKNLVNFQKLKDMTFYQLHPFIFSPHLSFYQRVQVQKLFTFRVHQFAAQSAQLVINYVNGLTQQTHNKQYQNKAHFQVVYKTQKQVILRHLQSKKMIKLALVTSQSLMINDEQKIYFDEQGVKNLKREFKVLNALEKELILPKIKADCSYKFRVALSALVEYRGVMGLVIDESLYLRASSINYNNKNKITEADYGKSVGNISNGSSNNNLHIDKLEGNSPIQINEKEMVKCYQRQLDTLLLKGYDLSQFTFKPVVIDSIKSTYNHECVLITLKKQIVENKLIPQHDKKSYLTQILTVTQPTKHHNIQFCPPFSHRIIQNAKQAHASTSLESLEFYRQTLDKLQQISPGDLASSTSVEESCTKSQIMQFLQVCIFLKHLRKIYRSGQGELQQSHFMSLLMEGDKNIQRLLQQSGYDNGIPKVTGLVINLIQYYLGVEISFKLKSIKTAESTQTNKFKSKSNQTKITSKSQKQPNTHYIQLVSIQPQIKIQVFDLSRLEVTETFHSISRFLSERNLKLAREGIKLADELQFELFPLTLKTEALQLTKSKALLAYLQRDYLQCINLGRQFIKLIDSPYDFKMIEGYLLMLRAYSHVSEEEFLSVYGKLLQVIKVNYSQGSSLMITVYRVGADLCKEIWREKNNTNLKEVRSHKDQSIVKQTKYHNNINNNENNDQIKSENNNKRGSFIELGSKLNEQCVQLAIRLYGNQSQQHISTMFSSIRFYSLVDEEKCTSLLQQAKGLIRVSGNKWQLVECILMEIELKANRFNSVSTKSLQQKQQSVYRRSLIDSFYTRGVNALMRLIRECQELLFSTQGGTQQHQQQQQTTSPNQQSQIYSLNSNNNQPTLNINGNMKARSYEKHCQYMARLQVLRFNFMIQYCCIQDNKNENLISDCVQKLWATKDKNCRHKAVIMLAKYAQINQLSLSQNQALNDYEQIYLQQTSVSIPPCANDQYSSSLLVQEIIDLLSMEEGNSNYIQDNGRGTFLAKCLSILEDERILSNAQRQVTNTKRSVPNPRNRSIRYFLSMAARLEL